jgi:hypothetical protein
MILIFTSRCFSNLFPFFERAILPLDFKSNNHSLSARGMQRPTDGGPSHADDAGHVSCRTLAELRLTITAGSQSESTPSMSIKQMINGQLTERGFFASAVIFPRKKSKGFMDSQLRITPTKPQNQARIETEDLWKKQTDKRPYSTAHSNKVHQQNHAPNSTAYFPLNVFGPLLTVVSEHGALKRYKSRFGTIGDLRPNASDEFRIASQSCGIPFVEMPHSVTLTFSPSSNLARIVQKYLEQGSRGSSSL